MQNKKFLQRQSWYYPESLTRKLSRPKIVFWLLVKTFSSIVTYLLIVIAFDLAKVLVFFGFLILFFNFSSIDINSKSFIIFATWTRTATVIFVSLLVLIRGLTTSHRYTRLSIGQLSFLSIVISRKLRKGWSLVFFDQPLTSITTRVHFSDTRGRL